MLNGDHPELVQLGVGVVFGSMPCATLALYEGTVRGGAGPPRHVWNARHRGARRGHACIHAPCNPRYLGPISTLSFEPRHGQEHGADGGACGVVYAFEARLQRPGVEKINAKGKAKLEVVARPEELTATPVTVGPFTRKFNSCCVSHGR